MRKTSFRGATIRRLLRYIVGHARGLFVLSCLCVLLSTAANVSGALFLQVLVDQYIAPLLLADHPVFTGLARVLATMAAVYLVGALCTLLYSRLMVRVSQGCLKAIRDDMFDHMQTLPIGYFDTHTHGDVMSHYTNDTDTLRQFISQALPQLFSCAITILAAFCVMVYYSWLLSLLVVAITALVVVLTKKVGGASTRYFMGQQTSLGEINGYIEEMLGGQKVVKVFCHEQQSTEGFAAKNDHLFYQARMANRYGNVLMPILYQIGNLQYVLLALVGGGMALAGVGGITPGVVVAFLSLSKSFSMPIQQIAQQISMVAMALAGAERIFTLLAEAPETDSGTVTLVSAQEKDSRLQETQTHTGLFAWKLHQPDGTAAYTKLTGAIQLAHVDFGYDPAKPILHDITLSAQPGQKIAFVGATGAGKTTVTNLLNRFYEITGGRICYDGLSIDRVQKPALRRSLGMVLQDTHLFTGTVLENIRYGRLDATDEACITAAKLAGAHDFISHLPQGYHTLLTGAGEGLSQGQRQLLSIARAAVADPPAMILDEATSSIDTRTEHLVQQGMDALMAGRTTFVIAHRLSTIQNADVIVVLDHGRILEIGDHDTLMAQGGTYYQLYTGAFELE
ncbi:ABC transporter ATP-binding protein [Evtepia gabavorous]|uniref:ABC transporter ATP-binding protein n=1 Tax=Evtepia gabavorous TaxID=2211183 RepID=UPI003A8D5D12